MISPKPSSTIFYTSEKFKPSNKPFYVDVLFPIIINFELVNDFGKIPYFLNMFYHNSFYCLYYHMANSLNPLSFLI